MVNVAEVPVNGWIARMVAPSRKTMRPLEFELGMVAVRVKPVPAFDGLAEVVRVTAVDCRFISEKVADSDPAWAITV